MARRNRNFLYRCRLIIYAIVIAAFMAMAAVSGAAFAQSTTLKIATIGAGNIGSTVGGFWIKAGHPVLLSSRHPEELKPLVDRLGPLARAGTVREALAFGDVILMAVPYGAYPQIAKDYSKDFAGKIVVDAGNAVIARDGEIAKPARENGVGLTTAKLFPGARIVRAFNILGTGRLKEMANHSPRFAIPVAGDDQEAVKGVSGLGVGRAAILEALRAARAALRRADERRRNAREAEDAEVILMRLTRRELLKAGIATGASLLLPAINLRAQSASLIQKKIPSSGESLPVVGVGTARRYESITTEAERAPLRETLREFKAVGATVIDSSPTYGTAEAVVGDLVAELKIRDGLFLATKVSTSGKEAGVKQIEESFKKLRAPKIDLIAVHNLRDTQTHLATLRDLHRAGRIRYVGITTSFPNQYADFERTMKTEKLDFIQVDYALDNRNAGERILPPPSERGMPALVDLPFS